MKSITRLLELTLDGVRGNYYASVWEPSATPLGRKIDPTILKEMRRAKLVLVLLSQEWTQSNWIACECAMGAVRDIPVIPLVLSDKMPKTFPPLVEDLVYVELDKVYRVEYLIDSISRITGLKILDGRRERVDEFVREIARESGADSVIPITAAPKELSSPARAFREALGNSPSKSPDGRIPLRLAKAICNGIEGRPLMLLTELVDFGQVKIMDDFVQLL